MRCSQCNNEVKLYPHDTGFDICCTVCGDQRGIGSVPGLEDAINTLINLWDIMPKTEIILLVNYEFGGGFLKTMVGLKKGEGRSDEAPRSDVGREIHRVIITPQEDGTVIKTEYGRPDVQKEDAL